MTKYKRVMLKLSGEMFLGSDEAGINFDQLKKVAKRIVEFKQKNEIELAIVVGAGNIWRFRDSDGSGIDRVTADKMGMLATILNGVALASAINDLEQSAVCLSGFSAPQLVMDFDAAMGREFLEDDTIVVLAGGTTNPYFTTDSAAVLRGLELNCDVLLKGTKVDGVYDADPMKNPDAKRYSQLTYQDAIEQNLEVMDLTAVALARDNSLPMLVFAFADENALMNVLNDNSLGTLVN
ncbi:UMP kinase [Candidatus Peregrinibacteria bacterium CG_4_10_14_0_2_um_filter_41_8]|nr:MAG: UMP kinase [Candidatus Peregrinibacteria bacterium CG_4_10_14_0_2_um_filter_41_8]